MKKGEKYMRNMKYTITFGIALVCAMLFIVCENNIDRPEIKKPAQNGYGRIRISLTNEHAALQLATLNMARSVLPSIDFDKYEYIFIKAGETDGVEKQPDNDGLFTLEVGNYTVRVRTYTGDILAANGVSQEFSVGPGSNNAEVLVLLSGVTYEVDGRFSYTITFPAGASAEITLQKWSDMSIIPLNPVNTTQGNGKTQTLELEPDSYLFTVLVSKTGLYAGLSEAVHINPLITTEYKKDFGESDLIAARIPLSSDYTVSVIENTSTVSVIPREDASPGAITVWYAGAGSTTYAKSTLAPVNAGTYMVTFDVTVAPGFASAAGLPAGTLTVINPTPVAGHYDISGTGTFTYDGTAKDVSITRKEGEETSPGVVTVLYDGKTTLPVNAGTYAVTFNVAAATAWNAVNGLSAGSIVINKATGAAVSASSGTSSITNSSITINAVTAPTNGQTVEYAKSTTTTAPASGYKDSTTFNGLSASTTYHIFARSKENANYNAGAAVSTPATTLHTYTVATNGSTTSKTTTLTFTFSGDPGAISASNITLSGNAVKGSAAVSGSGNTRILSPVTLNGTVAVGSVMVSISASGVEADTKTASVYLVCAGLYNKAPPILLSDNPVDISSASGSNIVDQAFNYINHPITIPQDNHHGTYTLVLNSDITVAGHSTAQITNATAVRHLKVSNDKLTIIGMDAERKISVTQGSGYGIFAVGRSENTGIELIIGNNITLVGSTTYDASDYTVQVQNGATFTMKDNASMSGNYYTGSSPYNRGISLGNACTFTMQDNAKITSRGVTGTGSTITMKNNASVTDGVSVGTNSTFVMEDNALVSGGGVTIDSNSTFTMKGNAKVFGSNTGVYVRNSGSTFAMQGNSSVFGNSRGVEVESGGTFTMGDYSSVYGNGSSYTTNGGGVYVHTGSSATAATTFTMYNYSSVYGNTAANGGGVYVAGNASYRSDFIMNDYASVSGNTATAAGAASGGGGVYVSEYGFFDMHSGVGVRIWGNKATGASGNGGGAHIGNNGGFNGNSGIIYGANASPVFANTANGIGAALYVSGSYANTTHLTSENTVGYLSSWADEIKNIKVTYNINGGTGTVPTEQELTAGNSITLNNGNGLTKTGYTFVGWNTYSTGTGTDYNAGTSFTPTGNITLYAKWDETLTANVWRDGNISSQGEQWFRFTAIATTQHIFVKFGTMRNMKVQLYESNRTTTVGNSAELSGMSTLITRSLNVGQVYYVKVSSGVGTGSTGTYQITFGNTKMIPGGILTAGVWADSGLNYLLEGENAQWFMFTATAATQYIHVGFDGMSLFNLNVQLYDSSGAVTVGSSENISGSGGSTRYISRTLTSGQVYWIKVTLGSTNSYRIAFNTSPTAPALGGILTAGVWADGNVPAYSNGVQWFIFTATAATQYIHATTTGIYVNVWDSDGNFLGQTNFTGTTKYTSLTLTSGDMYRIQVFGAGSNTYNFTYKLAINTSATPPAQ